MGEDEEGGGAGGGKEGGEDPGFEYLRGGEGVGVLGGCEVAAVGVAGLHDGVDEWAAAGVGGLVVGYEGVDGVADAVVGGEHGVDAAGCFVQALALARGTGLAPEVVEVERGAAAAEMGFELLDEFFERC